MRGHCKPDFDSKVTEFAAYINKETNENLTPDNEELLRKFGKFLEVSRQKKHAGWEKHGVFGFDKHSHHGHHGFGRLGRGFGRHGPYGHHGKHGHHEKFGHHGHHGKHGHHHGFDKHFYFTMFKKMSELRNENLVVNPERNTSTPQQEEATDSQEVTNQCTMRCGRRHHGHGGRLGRRGIIVLEQADAATETNVEKDDDVQQNLASAVSNIEITTAPEISETAEQPK